MEGLLSDEKESAFELHREQLEQLAVAAYSEILSTSNVDPSVKLAAADRVMKALGKDAPAKQGPGTANQFVFNFQGGVKTALGGMGQLQNLLARPAEGTDDANT